MVKKRNSTSEHGFNTNAIPGLALRAKETKVQNFTFCIVEMAITVTHL